MKKKTIMHIINSLALGGAESLLVGTISELIDYENIVILLKNENDFGDIKNCSHIYCIDFNSKKDVINSLCVLRKIIRQYNPNIIHAHLIESTLIARMACPSNVKFLFTVHNKMSLNCYQYSRMAWFFLPKSFKVYLKIDVHIAAARILSDANRSSEQYASIDDAVPKILARKKSENDRFLSKYSADCANFDNFDLVVDTASRTPDEVAGLILKGLEMRLAGEKFPHTL